MVSNKIPNVLKTIEFFINKYAKSMSSIQLVFTVNLSQGAIGTIEVQTKERNPFPFNAEKTLE